MITIYSYSACGTCKKALKWMDENDLKYDLIDIITKPPTRQLLEKAISQYGTKKPLFNTSGVSYRKLGASKVKAMSDEEGVDILTMDSKLIKRPFLITNKEIILIGFKKDLWEEVLKA